MAASIAYISTDLGESESLRAYGKRQAAKDRRAKRRLFKLASKGRAC